jgi:hypothetical protein
MRKRKCFIISLLLIISAICFDYVAKGYFSRTVVVLAKSFSISQADKAQARAENSELLRKGHIFQYFGVAFAILGFLFWLVSEFRREPVWRTIPFVLLVFCFLLQLIMV